MSEISNDVFVLLVFVAAALLHGVTGIGITLVTTTTLTSMYGLQHAIVLVLFPSVVINTMTWLLGGGRSIRQNAHHYLKHYWQLALTCLIGSVLGAKLLLVVNSAYMMLILAVLVGFYVITAISGKQIRLPANRTSMIGVGLGAGIIGGATNAISPVLLMYLLSISDDKNTIAKVGNLCYLLGKIAQLVVLHTAIARLSTLEWGLIGVLCAVSVLGLSAGIWLRQFLPQTLFRYVLLLILALLGLKVGYQGIHSLWA